MSITANLKKTYYYLKKNGIMDTYVAVRERLYARTSPLYMAGYDYVPVSEAELEKQRDTVFDMNCKFSILVPMYETKPEFAKAMIDSVLAQTYPDWELILADASKTDVVRDLVCGFENQDFRIRYVRIAENKGISANTNEALKYACGDYVGLLDHDDLLTPDALYEMALEIQNAKRQGLEPAFVYSDEDKCDTKAKIFYEPHVKSEFNWDLLLSNNYICHFLVMKTGLIQKLGFRKEFDGAQDFDLVLRACLEKEPEDVILHVEKVLYHWRCHDLSTAANPQSKLYAYEAGKRAVESVLKEFMIKMHGTENVKEPNEQQKTGQADIFKAKHINQNDVSFYVNNIPIRVVHTKHNGFYRVEYGIGTPEDIFVVRKDIGIVGGPVIEKRKITSGILNADGRCPCAGLPVKFSGYMHRMAMQQDCDAVDVKNMAVRPGLCNDIVKENKNIEDLSKNKKLNRNLMQKKDFLILYDPKFRCRN